MWTVSVLHEMLMAYYWVTFARTLEKSWNISIVIDDSMVVTLVHHFLHAARLFSESSYCLLAFGYKINFHPVL